MKERKKPHHLLAYEALLRRMKGRYRSNAIIQSDYQRFNAGFRGEKSIDYKLKILPHKEYLLYYGLRLKKNSSAFQMDTLILTENFICIVEIKNMREKLIYDSELKQLTQVTDGKEIGYKDPILQAETQKENLRMWLHHHGIPKIPIETLVVLANLSTIITNIHQNPTFYDKFIHAESLPFQITKLKTKHKRSAICKSKLKKLNDLLLENDSHLQSNLLKRYKIMDHHLIKGMPCPSCYHYPMKRLYRRWSCSNCSYSDNTAHKRVILDYFLLFKDNITNRECRELLQIDSRKSAYLFLQSMDIGASGHTKGKKYYAPHIEKFPQNSIVPLKEKSILEPFRN